MEKHSILDDKVHVDKKRGSPSGNAPLTWTVRNHRVSTKEESLKLALEFAREWYMAVYVAFQENWHDLQPAYRKPWSSRFRGEDEVLVQIIRQHPSPLHRQPRSRPATEKGKRSGHNL